jgi:hypothetical protein
MEIRLDSRFDCLDDCVFCVVIKSILMISQEVRREVCERDGIFNPDGYDGHHCFSKGKYFKEDQNEAWNIAPIRRFIHDCIHHSSTDEMVRIGKEWDIKLKEEALARYQGKYRSELEAILKRKKHEIQRVL